MLRVTFPVGEAFSTGLLFNLDFLTKDIAVVSGFPSLYDPEVSSSASQGSITQRTVVTYDAYFNKKDIKGDGWYDTMTLEEVSVAGQGFIFQPNPVCPRISSFRPSPQGSSNCDRLGVVLDDALHPGSGPQCLQPA